MVYREMTDFDQYGYTVKWTPNTTCRSLAVELRRALHQNVVGDDRKHRIQFRASPIMFVDLRKTCLDQFDASEQASIELSLQSCRIETQQLSR
jgi:hypothetical protein